MEVSFKKMTCKTCAQPTDYLYSGDRCGGCILLARNRQRGVESHLLTIRILETFWKTHA
jgi:hypothetical protein